MQSTEFTEKLTKLFETYLRSKYPNGLIPVLDILYAWGYSVNSYSHIQKLIGELLKGDRFPDKKAVSIDDFIHITLYKRLNINAL